MQKTLMILAAASIGIAATAEVRPSSEMVADLGHSLADGVILGGVWPYSLSPVPPELQSASLLSFSTCDQRGQCGMYALAATTFLDRWTDNTDSEKEESVGLSSSLEPRTLGQVPR
jgi:hypothetical protein